MIDYKAIAESSNFTYGINFRFGEKKEPVLKDLHFTFNAIRYTIRELSSIIRV